MALGRAVARRPAVLLLDEPFSSLDEPLRAALRAEVVELHRRFGSTLVHVTHDQAEAMSLGQSLAVLHQGRLMQHGSPREIYERPAHRFVAAFVGNPGMNILEAETGHADDLGVRPESVAIAHDASAASSAGRSRKLSAIVRRLEFQGDAVLATLAAANHSLVARVPATENLVEGQEVAAVLDLDQRLVVRPHDGPPARIDCRTGVEGVALVSPASDLPLVESRMLAFYSSFDSPNLESGPHLESLEACAKSYAT